jgi:hypothetical protein
MVQTRRRSTPTPSKGIDVAPLAKVGATLLDIADGEQMRSEQKRRRRSRDHHGAVQKCSYENYNTLSSSEIDMKRANGMTWRETLLKAKEDKVSMGKKFHDELREKFAPTDATIGGLVSRDLNGPDDKKLKKRVDEVLQAAPRSPASPGVLADQRDAEPEDLRRPLPRDAQGHTSEVYCQRQHFDRFPRLSQEAQAEQQVRRGVLVRHGYA